MYLSHFRSIITVCVIQHLVFTGGSNSLVQQSPVDDIAVNCGFSGSSFGSDGREWIGDMDSTFTSPKEVKGKSIISSTTVHQSLCADHVPYMTPRISRSPFTYTSQVMPGQKFIRLHFCPASYPGFERSKALFTVKAGPYTLLSNFSTSLTADALGGVSYFAKEFCVNIEENQVFNITFSPSKRTCSSQPDDDDVYAFINGIEIVSIPTGLYYTPDGDLGPLVVGNKFFRYYIDNGTALEMVHRLNVGGRSILPVEDLGMFRMWSDDKNYLLQSSSLLQVSTSNIIITYTNIPTHSAPLEVYQTTWSTIGSNQQMNQVYNFTWKLPVDLGFRYLVRLHFCELEPTSTTEGGQKQLDLLINNKKIEIETDVIKLKSGAAVYRDYVVLMEGDRMDGRRDIIIALQLNNVSSSKQIDAIVKGIEVFKLSNPDNNLAGVNPVFTANAPISRNTPRFQKLVLAFGSINTIPTGIVLVLSTLLYFIVYLTYGSNHGRSWWWWLCGLIWRLWQLLSHRWRANYRIFSVAEIRDLTNNFNDGHLINTENGGDVKVYEGYMEKMRKVVIKRYFTMPTGTDDVYKSLRVQSQLECINMVSLVGYCLDEDGHEMILVHEYMANGTLLDHLHNTSNNNQCLSWKQRLQICIGAARGLSYLHTKTIIHGDVKLSNILLDQNWVAKMNFSLLVREKNTLFADEEKSDVYSFGIVLLQVLSGSRKAFTMENESEWRTLSELVLKCIDEAESAEQIIDPFLNRNISHPCLRAFGEIANKCLLPNATQRPPMTEVVRKLELALQLEEHISEDSTLPYSLQVRQFLQDAGLESCNLIVGIDFTGSNQDKGMRSFNGRCLHDINGDGLNPYEQSISIIGKALADFAPENLIPCFGFGDESTRDKNVFSFYPDKRFCNGFKQVLSQYREIVPHLKLSAPTSFAPIIEMAMTIVEQSDFKYHVLLLIAYGEVSRSSKDATLKAIVEASKFPLSIILVGVGDGPWDMMRKFSDDIPDRAFNNFHFVNFTEIMSKNLDESLKEAEFALTALMEIPSQNKVTIGYSHPSGRKGNAPRRVALPPPPFVPAPPAPVQKDEVHCGSFSVAEIRDLTNNFNDGHLINTENGGDVKVYEGYMEKMRKVVIKRYFTMPTGTDDVYKSLRVQSQLECINMVSLVGYCLDEDGHEMILVHEYMANGTLLDHLHNTSNNNQCLSWKQRLQICIGAARGLSYLHTKTIIHGDVKLSNILLDQNWVAKMNFSVLVREKNTLVADEEKSDVYSFGIVLLQVLSGSWKAFTMENESEWRTLSGLVLKCIDEAESAEQIIDPFLNRNISHPCLRAFGEIANKCLLLNATQRPLMTEVVCKLELALQLEEIANNLINKEREERISEVSQFLKHAGLESCNLIVGIDFTGSNKEKGMRSFNGRCLHDIDGDGLNPYEHSISIIGKALADFAPENLIPCFGFGDESTRDKNVFSFYPDKRFCNGFKQVLSQYREIVPHLKLSAPTSFAPIIEMAMTIVEQSDFKYHVLLLIAYGEVSRSSKDATLKAIVEASMFPLSIILVGVGDGPWDMMRKFSDDIPDRAFNNFHFVNFTEIMSKNLDESLKEAEFALTALMEIPSQNKATIGYSHPSGRKGNAPRRVALPPPPFVPAPPAPVQKDEVHCGSFSVAEIRDLTNNFNDGHLINTENGGDVKVYEGYMEKMRKVVIKRYFTMPTGTDDVYKSLRVQSQLECINMVSLVGYCLDEDGHEMILVHEYMANGTLLDHLHNTSNNNQCLSWKQRLQICIGAARGLSYLHTKTIIHGDVKLSNILLDQNWVAKMNFSLLVREKNTLFADEEKSDVYSFGIVLLQVLSGSRKAFTMGNESEWRTLSELVLKCIDEAESAEQIIDPFLNRNISHPCLRAFGVIANKCLLPNATQRPPMTEVVRKLELALQLEEHISEDSTLPYSLQVRQFLQDAGLESCNLIVGIDFTGSNQDKGMRSFNGRCLHDINGDGLNPYEQSISIIGKALGDFAPENLIPCFGFGDDSTRDKNVFSFYPDKTFCNGFEQVLSQYREIVPHLKLSAPTSFAPIIEMAMTIVEQSDFKYHVLLLIADGEVSRSSKDATLKAIVEASKFPLSIILVGVGDGPWDMMRKFSDDIPDRAFNNFHFVNFTEIMSKNLDESLKEAEFALTALMEIPSQNKVTIGYSHPSGRKGNAPRRVALPPPPFVPAPPAPVQKDEVHCGSFSVAEIRDLTNNFNDGHLINTENGGDVKVYEGYMEKMRKVVIKRYFTMPTGTDDVYKSLRVQSQLECINMVSLVGYCLDEDGHEMILVHEYMANGTLLDHLHNTSNNNQCLSWKQRLQICIGAARGLSYLHTKTIIHGDVKLSNILLDQNWVAKMNFSVLVREKNTLVADEEKSDVYSFGIVLLQVLSGSWKAFTMENESEWRTLSGLVLKCIDEAESAEQIIDPFLNRNISHPCLRAFGEIANKCLLLNATQRPLMTEVVCKLELALQLEEIANNLINKEREERISEVSQFLKHAGLESCNLIVGIDFTGSNKEKGMRSFNGRCLHDIDGDGLNPYEHSISIIGKALADFAPENLIPCFGFGDESTRDKNVFSFYPDKRFCNGFKQVLSQYREIVPHLKLSAPTSFAPIIEMAMTIVEQSDFKYHVLLLIAYGEVSRSSKDATLKAIVEASMFPLSIILVGVGDGPWDMMRKFSDDIPDRAFNNFHFVNFTEIMSKNLDESLKEAEFALTALMEIPSQNKATIGYSHPSGRKGNAPRRVALPPPPFVPAPPAPVQKDEVHCGSFSVAEIRDLTNNFNDGHLINTENGGDVKVYEGYMEKMRKVVIKRYFTMPTGTDDVYKSLRVQSQLECINMVSLVGYCLDEDGHEMILVQEYMANGTLLDHLHNTSNNNQCLSWKQRLQICIGAARGLSYLHTKTIIHGDVKLSNILLDQNWVAKMNFSLLVREKNTLFADEEKSDVYSFGIVLLQVLSGSRKAFTMGNESEWRTLSELVLKCIDEAESAEQIIDPFLNRNISHPCLRAFGEIANKCLLPNATQRPPMTEVVRKLELALQLEEHISEFLQDAGLESCNLIVGIDFTGSNQDKGMRSFNGRCLHDINGDGLNPYEQSISIIGKALADFAPENLIPCFGFGDESTRDKNVFSFYPDKRFCNGFEQVLSQYREIVPHLKLSAPTSFAPIIEMAMTIVEQSDFKYHVLLLIADGEVSRSSKDATLKAIVEASKFPLSIILVGVGDGPWDMMRKFSDDILDLAFNNFHFVNFTEIMSKNLDESLKEAEFALTALMEIPSQNKVTIGYSHPSGRKGNAPRRVALPPPPFVPAPPAPIQKDEVHCGSFSVAEIRDLTNNFNDGHLINTENGGDVKVYEGYMEKMRKVVIKRYFTMPTGTDDVYKSLRVQSQLECINMVSLVGYCLDEDGHEMILVHEYMANGTLLDHLHNTSNNNQCLSWKQRLQICIGAARGLSYLHTKTIIHGDVKLSNILLDQNWVAKMNFSVLVREKNTLVADEEKSDVYSFGIVLLQVLSGSWKAFTMENESEWRTLSGLVLKCIDEAESAEQIIDPFLNRNISHPCLCAFGEIANKCLLLNATQRPLMTEVVCKLELALQLGEIANNLINKEREERISEVSQFLKHAGLESCNLIVGIDFTGSNKEKGMRSFNGRCLHDIDGDGLNPYEHSISIIGKALADFAPENLIPCFGFGDESTRDKNVFSFYPDKRFCNGFKQVLSQYREIVPHLKLSAPTSFAPIIEMAMTIVEQSDFKYHVLLLIAYGEVSRSSKDATLKAIVEASMFPLSIILVGVGDGPWDMMRKFSDDIPDRAFNNFHFVNFTEIMSKNLDESLKEAEFALTALMEIPSQNKATIGYSHPSGRKGNAPRRVALPPPPFVPAPPAPVQKDEVHCGSFSVAEIRDLTNNFNDGHLINTENGGDVKVYEGYMEKMRKVVIKRYFTMPTGTDDVYKSLRVQSQLECINMVSLVGYCLDEDGHEMILVHEYMANGTLLDHLHNTSNNNQCLSWKQRLQICIGAARGLSYLHTKTIIHGDVKLSNILLDQNWVAKMNFSVLVREKNTLVADEEKSDVYSFGIVLLQVLSGSWKAFTMENESEWRTLSGLVLKCIDEAESAEQIIDPFLNRNISHPCLRAFGEIANKCLLLNATQRPLMTEVVCKLELALQLEEIANNLINKEREERISEVSQFLKHAGLESCNLIVGIDFTGSNKEKGMRSFNGRCLHHINDDGLNPYEQSISIIGKALAHFAHENLIPCFGFGDKSPRDKNVFSFYPDKRFCNGFEQVLSQYREIVPHLKLFAPTSFAPIIEMAMTIVEQSGFKYHVLLLIADGQVSPESKDETLEAIVEASKFPLSIILVGVGDGTWDMMRKFSDDIPDRAFNNFHFVNFTEIMSKNLDESLKEAEFALTALMELPSQNKATIELNILGGRKGNAPRRVALPPPPFVPAPPAPVQKDEVHCGSFSVAEIRDLTNNFNDGHLINTENGGDVKVYEGYMEKMRKVVIKRYFTMPTGTDDVYKSLRVQSQLECINMVSLVGYCLDYDGHEMILVHEYMANGTLLDHLQNTSNNNQCLSWKQRLQICIGAARGLSYLHTKTIIHGDVKLSNILLDQNWVAKMNFSVLVREKNTLVADEEKSDVYSFGIVLLQVLSGSRKAFTMENESEWRTLSGLVLKCIDEAESAEQIIDPFLKGNISHPCLRAFGEIANKCLLLNATQRPLMTEIVCKLELALQLEEIANNLINKEKEEHISEVSQFLKHAGLESCNLIVGIDFTGSNKKKGMRSFNRRCLHHINGDGLNPYEQSISIIGKALAHFDHENLIPCFGFGDKSTRDKNVFSFYPDKRFCNGFEQVLSQYREIVPHLKLSAPTSFAPIIEMAMTIVEQSDFKYHVLLLIADGEVSRSSKDATLKAIVEASMFPLSIILVGVGDGPWDMMRKFSDDIPDRAFNNFHFVNFTEIMSKNLDESLKEAEFALTALMEIPSQNKATIGYSHPSGRKGNAPRRVALPPPPFVPAPPAPVQKDEVHCGSFSVAEIRDLTNNFNDGHLINTENGGDVKVYEGYMEKMRKVVIKRYFTMPTGTDDVYKSLRVQSQLECINMVSLVGYCLDEDGHEMILVQEYMANGTLLDHLHNTSNNNQCLSWKQRLQICIGAARGLSYLHTKTIIHGDVKLSNILLDQNWVAKMNFSLLVREKNTLFADEEKSDVYSFGIVLLQVLSGSRKAFTMGNESEWRTLSELVLKCIDEAESAEQIIDPFLNRNISHPCLRAFGEIANKCLLPNATQRPPMTEVVRKLELALQLEEHISEDSTLPYSLQVRQFLQDAGLESCNLIVGIDFTGSNQDKGMRSFNGRCLHDINGDGLNPYEQSISIIGKALADFAPENLIPCFGFGDESTRDKNVFSFYPDKRFCNGFEQVLSQYREIVPHLKLSAPTSFAPIIEMAMTIVEQSDFKYHVLLLIADGEVSRSSKDATLKAIVEASKFPLSIILVGVGDGPWDMMRKFSDDILDLAFNNFHFVNFTEIMSKNLDESLKEAEFALTALMEIPSQNKVTIGYSHPSGRKGNAPRRVALPPPPFVPAPPAPIQKDEVHCGSFSVAEIRDLTNNFNDGHLINTENGGDVKVYEGYMEKMRKVVIKRYFTMPTGTDDVYKSLRVQSQLECINMVSLVGYCLDEDGHEMILVHEYMANGTLLDHLHNTSNNNQCLSWKQRLQICIGAARGLSYLHTKTIIHGDVKLSNILLDQNWVAKMNFSVLVREKNTLVADEEKSDVYSFGIVLLQVLSGSWKAFTMENESEWRTLSGLVLKCIDEAESAEQIIDPFLNRNISHPCLCAFGEIANKCLLLNATQRPLMTEVVCKLELALQLGEIANNLINKEREERISEVSQFLKHAGLESCNLIVGIDFTGSNKEKGMRSFNGRCLHDIDGDGLNPYEHSISIIGKALADFAPENLIPCFGFGDESTRDKNVFSFYPDKRFCNGFKQVLSQYREIVPHLKLSAPTSFAPIIEMAMTIVEQSDFKYHVLLLIAYGEVSRSSKDATLKAIVEASMFPLSIILVGVGDGPWDMMRKFSDDIPDRAFNNFHFVNFTEIMSKNLDESLKEAEFALTALMEIPSQNKATIGYSHPSGRKGNAPRRVALPPPPFVPAPPAPVQKDEVHCGSFSVAEIRDLTNNFNDGHLINTENGGDVKVYEGYMEKMRKVVIKRYFTMPTGTDDVYKSLRVQSQLECINMVSLVGYCLDEDGHEMILVHEYMANGTLLDHLHNTSNNNQCLSWKQRLQICIGAARGLSYLHTKTIIHGDVKLSNILLDQNWVAKMNFSVLVREKNTLVADEEKSDVYSFGIVLLQVLSGSWKAFTMENESEWRTLSGLVLKCIDEAESAEQIIDPFLNRNISHPCLRAFGEIANKCLLLNATQRPLMTEVVCKLELALQLEEIANNLINKEREERISEVSQFLKHAGLESCNLIVGIDFTGSNKEKGMRSFNGRCLHHINDDGLNPYEQSISIIGKALAHFAHENLIPCFGFGDKSPRDKNVFSFYPDKRFCNGFEQVLSQYREIVPHLKLFAPTSFAPIIEMAMTIVEQSGFKYHVLLLIADGQVSRESKDETLEAIVEASKFPLSIILVGVGDGPWDMMRKFSDDIPDRAFNNFHFVNFTEIMSKNLDESLKEAEFALTALMELPSQNKATIELNILGGPKGNSPGRVPLPPPLACDENP